MDVYYFKEIQGDELRAKINASVNVIPYMKTMDEVSKFMSENQNIDMPEDGLQWRVWIVPDFRDG